MSATDIAIPLIICFICLYGIIHKVDVFAEFVVGAKENLAVAVDIIPALIILLTSVGMFTSSGVTDLIQSVVSPYTSSIGFPSEYIPLAIIRPISGSGALAVLETILTSNSPDSYVGRVSSVMMGSAETTFYTIAVYFSAVKLKCTYKVIIPAISADISGFIFSGIITGLILGC